MSSDEVEKIPILISKVRGHPALRDFFADWQAKLNALITTFPGFVSLEILSSTTGEQPSWTIVQRFHRLEEMNRWQTSQERIQLISELNRLLANHGLENLKDEESQTVDLKNGVTEVFVTQVNPEKEKAYREWLEKIHQVEAKFPGFRGMYVQAPTEGKGDHWITLLQFDSPKNLDEWLASPERKKVLEESESLIDSLESHRVISPYAGWFASVAKEGRIPPAWKQTMIVLLVLFPIVMLEMKYLSPLTAGLNPSLSTFISNAISVSLIAWPMTPIAIWFLSWWLLPKADQQKRNTILGTLLVLALYVLEIILFWII